MLIIERILPVKKLIHEFHNRTIAEPGQARVRVAGALGVSAFSGFFCGNGFDCTQQGMHWALASLAPCWVLGAKEE